MNSSTYGLVEIASINPGATASNAQGSLSDDWPTLGVLERRYIDLVLGECGGNKKKAAELLGIPRGTLYDLLGKAGAEPERSPC